MFPIGAGIGVRQLKLSKTTKGERKLHNRQSMNGLENDRYALHSDVNIDLINGNMTRSSQFKNGSNTSKTKCPSIKSITSENRVNAMESRKLGRIHSDSRNSISENSFGSQFNKTSLCNNIITSSNEKDVRPKPPSSRESELDSGYLKKSLRQRARNGQYAVVGVKDLERLYKAVPELDFSCLRKADSSVKATVGSQSVSQCGSNDTNDISVRNRVRESRNNISSSIDKEKVQSIKDSAENVASVDFPESSRMSTHSISSVIIYGHHSIISGHNAVVVCLAASASGAFLVSAEEGQPIGRVSDGASLA